MEVGVVWKYLKGRNLNGAHNSLVDTKAQTGINLHEHFLSNTYQQDIASPGHLRDIQQNSVGGREGGREPIRPVHAPWKEQTLDDNIEWEPAEDDRYLGHSGGPPAGLSDRGACRSTSHTLITI